MARRPAPTGRRPTDRKPTDRKPRPRPAPPAERYDVKGNANGPTWAITNARIVTVSGPVIPKGTIVIKGNRIEAAGANVTVPSGVKPVDAGGATVMPGMIDASTDIGLNEPGVRNYDDVSEILPFDQMLRTRVAFKADSIAIPVARTEGITTVAVRPGGGTISGEIPVMNLDGWTWEEATLRPAAGLAFNFPGAAGGRGGGGGGRGGAAPQTGPDPMKTLNQLLERARVYAKQPATRQVDWTSSRSCPCSIDARRSMCSPPPNRASAMRWPGPRSRTCVSFCRPAPTRNGSPDCSSSTTSRSSSRASCRCRRGKTSSTPTRIRLLACWPKLVFRSRSRAAGSSSRDVPFQAGRAVGWGLSRDDAIKALTLDAARILGVDSQVGSIDPGKIANLVVINGDPLEIRSQIQHVIIAGRDVSLDNSQVELLTNTWRARGLGLENLCI